MFDDNDVNSMFNSFINAVYDFFYFSFHKIKKTSTIITDNGWVTPTVKALCCFKRNLYLLTKNKSDPKSKNYYKVCCKILSNTVRETKMSYCNRQIFTSENKIKTTWYIVKVVTGSKSVREDIHILNINDNLTNNQQIISNSFKDHFLCAAGRMNSQTSNNSNPDRNYSIPWNVYYRLLRLQPKY